PLAVAEVVGVDEVHTGLLLREPRVAPRLALALLPPGEELAVAGDEPAVDGAVPVLVVGAAPEAHLEAGAVGLVDDPVQFALLAVVDLVVALIAAVALAPFGVEHGEVLGVLPVVLGAVDVDLGRQLAPVHRRDVEADVVRLVLQHVVVAGPAAAEHHVDVGRQVLDLLQRPVVHAPLVRFALLALDLDDQLEGLVAAGVDLSAVLLGPLLQPFHVGGPQRPLDGVLVVLEVEVAAVTRPDVGLDAGGPVPERVLQRLPVLVVVVRVQALGPLRVRVRAPRLLDRGPRRLGRGGRRVVGAARLLVLGERPAAVPGLAAVLTAGDPAERGGAHVGDPAGDADRGHPGEHRGDQQDDAAVLGEGGAPVVPRPAAAGGGGRRHGR